MRDTVSRLVAHRFDLDDFTVATPCNEENDLGFELSWKYDQTKEYTHGTATGHIAMRIGDCGAARKGIEIEGLERRVRYQ